MTNLRPIPIGKEIKKNDGYLREYQKQLIYDMGLSPSPDIYNGSQMGTGKTPMSICYANLMRVEQVLVVCPALLRLNWVREYNLWSTHTTKNRAFPILSTQDVVRMQVKSKTRKGFLPSPTIVSYELLASSSLVQEYIFKRKWDLIFLDEVHYCRVMEAKRTKIVRELWDIAPMVMALSGTPMVKGAIDLYPIVSKITENLEHISDEEYERYTDFRAFTSYHSYRKASRYKDGWDYFGVRNAKCLKQFLRDTGKFFFRVTKEEALPDLPDKTYDRVDLPVKVGLSDDLDQFLESYEEFLDYDPEEDDYPPSVSALRRELGVAKSTSKHTIDFIESLFESGEPVVIFAYHKEVVKNLLERFNRKKFKIKKITGDESATQKDAINQEFQNGKLDGIICNYKAGGIGLNFTYGCTAVMVEYSYIPSDNEQAVDRLHRFGQKKPVMVYYVVCENKFDKSIVKNMIQKYNAIKRVL